MELTELEHYDSVKCWLRKLEIYLADFNEELKQICLNWLQQYCEYFETNPDMLIADRAKTLESNNPTIRGRHEDYLDSFIVKLSTEKLQANKLTQAINVIRGFYRANYVSLQEF